MFLGSYQTNFSSGSRVILPKKFRQELGLNIVILSRGLDGCIWGFTKKDWQRETKKQFEIPISEERGRFLRRMFFSAAEQVELDDQGRFVIPKILLQFAALKKEVLLIGAGDHFEIWNPKLWQKVIEERKF